VVVSVGLLYNLHHYSGVLFQVSYHKPHKKHKHQLVPEVLASGGRYDKLVCVVFCFM
jgi:histidyl-tRNA synthetase